eukprot:TRINITY_DN2328_c0_g1_i2.p1 TRINITY_DN2328_c0_g1~~TRINITY_DN2328_c0_g1_i2.p1  ORF type:complete len:218 (+),score=54.95 TRINITY_DN2328_c0_g1_i2:72-725(+)
MTILTLIARLSDGLMLSEAMDSADDKVADVDAFRTQAKKIIKSLSRKSPTKMTVETGNYYFCYIIEGDIVYLTLCERSYPKKLAVKFLEELQKEFDIQYGAEALTTKRPYAFIKFDTFIQKTKKVYADTRSQRNLSKVTEDLNDVNRIMTKNISEILGRGEKINSVAKKSDDLLASSALYEKAAKNLNSMLFFRQYGPLLVVVIIVILLLYLRSYFY